MSRADRFLNACRGEPVDATPIWLMRQAGRYMPEYRALRAKYGILEMIKTPELAAEVTLQPVRAFDIDAAIIFADILPALEEAGLDLEFIPGKGPVIHNPVRSPSDVERLGWATGRGGLEKTMDAIRLVQSELDGLVPLIGFAGAPFTLACYAIEGGSSRDFLSAKQFMYEQPAAWDKLLTRISDILIDYLQGQVEAGVNVIQLFDSWAGALSPADYRTMALPYTQRVLQAVQGVPRIHFGTGLSGFMPLLKETGADILGVDWRMDLADARAQLGPDQPVQGNLDPAVLFAPADEIRRQAKAVLDANAGRNGFIFNLGHGVFKETPVEHVRTLVDFVHEYRK